MRLPQRPPDHRQKLANIIASHTTDFGGLVGQIVRESPRQYHHWDDLRRRKPPTGLSVDEWWAMIKLTRAAQRIELPLIAKSGAPCAFTLHPGIVQECHELDERQSQDYSSVPAHEHERYSVTSLFAESAMSSIIEGAGTRLDEAVTLLRTGRKPVTKGERMVVDNHQAMRYVYSIAGETLTPERVLELQRLATEDTLGPDEAGRYRHDDERIRVYDEENRVLHDPPPAAELPERMETLCAFANGQTSGVFIHRVVRAILVHYWLAYDHPFIDGNGRTARALFYWCLLHHGFEPVRLVSISSILASAPAQYARSYQLCQTDEDDLTYFIDYQLKVIQRAFEELDDTVRKKTEEENQLQALLDESDGFNHRQLALLSHALRHPGFWYTIQSHRASHAVVYETAREDLLQLAERGLLHKTKRGKAFHFQAPMDLNQRIREAGKARA